VLREQHQLLLTIDEVEPAPVREADGWQGLKIRFVGADITGAAGACLFHAEFPPGATHQPHVHPHADEYYCVISGTGMAGTGASEHPVQAGAVHYVPAGSVHWLRNTDGKVPIVVVGIYAGVGSLAEAGYERVEVQAVDAR
jgi:mannose-6-phosphate isomerase-like protein (cupin superfamily)